MSSSAFLRLAYKLVRLQNRVTLRPTASCKCRPQRLISNCLLQDILSPGSQEYINEIYVTRTVYRRSKYQPFTELCHEQTLKYVSLNPDIPQLITCEFNVHGSVHRNNILVYKSQQDAQVTEFIFV